MHLLKLNGGVPGMSLGLSFWRDLLYTAAKLLKKGLGVCLHGFLYWRECLVNDMCAMACVTLHCDAFYVTTLRHWYRTYQCGSMGGNCIMKEKDGIALPRPEALTLRSPV